MKYHYLKKLSGKNYHPDAVKEILISLGFDIVKEGIDELVVAVPFHKPDISLPADIVEEIVRIDGLDNIEIPASITMTPSVEENYTAEVIHEKTANYLTGLGFNEIMTNSITNEVHFDEEELQDSVKMLNNLSAELNIMRPSMLETGLECIAYNLNRKNSDLRFFDFGKTYSTKAPANYCETDHLCLYIAGNVSEDSWRGKTAKADFYFLKGVVQALLNLLGVDDNSFGISTHKKLSPALQMRMEGSEVLQLGAVRTSVLNRFGINQPVFFADINWSILVKEADRTRIKIGEIPKFPAVYRDLAIVVPAETKYEEAERTVQKLKLNYLQGVKLFDVFESNKLGEGKKSMAMSFTFLR